MATVSNISDYFMLLRVISSYLLIAWNSACALERNLLPQSSQTRELATSPSFSAGGSAVASSSPLSALLLEVSAWISSSVLFSLQLSQSRAPWTSTEVSYLATPKLLCQLKLW